MIQFIKKIPIIKNLKNFSISRILTISLTLTVIVVSFVTFSISYLILFEKAKIRIGEKADEFISLLALVLEIPVWEMDGWNIKKIGEAYAYNEFVERLKITDEWGNVFFDYKQESHAATVSRSSQIIHEGQSIGLVEISLTARPYSESNTRSLLSGMISLLSIVLVLVLVTKIFSSILMNRLLDKLGGILNAYSSGKHNPVVHDMPFLEFQPLVNVLDEMRTKIDSQMMELRNAEKKYRGIFENAVEGIFQSTPDGHYLSANPAMARILGYDSTEELIGNIKDINNQLYVNPGRYKEFIQLLRKGKSVAGFQIQLYRKDRKIVWASLHVCPFFDEYGKLTLMEGIIQDITERKRMEEEILRIQKLESVGILAGGIAHDFNNILTSILGNVSMAKNQTTRKSENYELLSDAESASKKAQALTKQLLTFAKGGTPVKESTSIGDIIKESSLFVLRGSKSSCEFSIAKDLWPVEVDVGQVSQVINNIVINANQAMPEGGNIKVAVENLTIEENNSTSLKPGKYIRISVKDQGVGIPEKDLVNIFDPYFTTKQEGSGLGLAISYSIINKHDGYITVESQLGIGTTFYIYLPASEKPVHGNEVFKLITGQGRILVMDDEVLLRRAVGKMLKKLGYESELVKDGTEVIRMYKAAMESGNPYDVVILDLTIPGGMGGKECIKKLSDIDPRVKAIVSSGYSDDPVLANYREYGFKGMLPKPFEFWTLGKVLYEALQGKKE